MKNQILLLEDVFGLGRSGDIVTVKSGYSRNFLFPKQKAVVAEKHLVKLQERLKADRAKKSEEDKEESLTLAKKLEGKVLTISAKIDANGHMYGSVTQKDVVKLLKEQLDMTLDRHCVILAKPLKRLGKFEIELKLKEGVPSVIALEISAQESESE